MKRNLSEMIRYISSKNGNVFTSSLREELNDRLFRSMANRYLEISENLYPVEISAEVVQESKEISEAQVKNFPVTMSQKHETAAPVLPKKRVFQKPINPGQMKEENSTNELISSLQESIRDEKTIIHHFQNGDTVTITNEDSQSLVRLHDSLNKMNQEKMRKLMSENYSEYNKILQFSKKYTERTQK